MAFNPFFYNDSPLPLELIHKALTELDYINKNVLPTVDELKTKVDKLIADLDDAIKDEVQRVINDMYVSGELGQIIGQAIAQSMTGKSGNFDLQHMGYSLHKAHSYAYSTLPDADASLTYQEELYNALQGNCVLRLMGICFGLAAMYVRTATRSPRIIMR